MKYTIEGFNQEEVIKLGNLDVIDLVILRWIVDFEPKMTKKEIDGEIYFWVNYQSLLEALPILKLGKRSLYDRLMKMCNLKILKHKNIKENGNYSYYTFDENYINLVQKRVSIDMKQISEGYEDNFQTLMKKTSEQNNSSIKEINLLNNSKENIKESFDSDLFNKFWKAYPKKKSKGNVEKWFLKNKPSEELVNTMIKKINLLKNTEQWKSKDGQYIPYPTTWLNAKGWEDEIKQENKFVEEDIHDRARRIFGNN